MIERVHIPSASIFLTYAMVIFGTIVISGSGCSQSHNRSGESGQITEQTAGQIGEQSPQSRQETVNPTSSEKLKGIIQTAPDPELSLPRLSGLIQKGVNRIRSEHNLDRLSHNSDLDPIALAHSKDMAVNNYFEHTNLDGESATDRGLRTGFECRITFDNMVATGLAENLFLTSTYNTVTRTTYTDRIEETYDFRDEAYIATEVVQGWYHSPPHRKNLLDEHSLTQGIGIYITADRKVYITQNLC